MWAKIVTTFYKQLEVSSSNQEAKCTSRYVELYGEVIPKHNKITRFWLAKSRF